MALHKMINRRMYYALQIAGVGVLLSGCFLVYRWHSGHREEAAQRRFSDCVKEYTNTATVQSGHQNWNMIVGLFELGAQEYAGTSLEPFYRAYQAQALLKDNKLSEAVVAMDQAVAKMSPENELYSMYALKNVLMHIDADISNDSREKNEAQLVALAEDKNNKQRDEALFYLGRYYLSQGNSKRSQEVLQELMSISATDKHAASPWAKEAEQLLKQVVA